MTQTVVEAIDEAMGKLLGTPANSLAYQALVILGNEVPRLRNMSKALHEAHLALIEQYGTPGYSLALETIQNAEMALAGDQTR